MEYLSKIIANAKNKKLFYSYLTEKKLSHAYLVVGPDGSGKKTFVEALICEYATLTRCQNQVASIQSKMCPDIVWATKEEGKKTFGVDAVRSAISTVSLSTNALDFKFYIFEEAELLTVQAQNALLKVIEEPPKNTYFILLCNNVATMIQTVRSRVQTVYMEMLSEEEISDYLDAQGINIQDKAKKDYVLRLCNGACGRAITLAQNEDEYATYQYVCEVIRMQSTKANGTKYFDFIQKIVTRTNDREGLSEICDFLTLGFRDILAVKSNENAKTRFLPYEEALELSETYADEALELSISSVGKVRNALVFNTNLNTSLTVLAELLWKSV